MHMGNPNNPSPDLGTSADTPDPNVPAQRSWPDAETGAGGPPRVGMSDRAAAELAAIRRMGGEVALLFVTEDGDERPSNFVEPFEPSSPTA